MNLFELENYKVKIQPEAYALLPFKKIWDRDKSKDKSIAIEELAYVYYTTDYQSDFLTIIDEKERAVEVIKYCSLPKGWKIDKDVQDAIEFYKKMQETIATKLLEKSYVGVSKLMQFYDEVDLMAMNDKGAPVYNAKQLADTIKSTSDIIKSLRQLEDIVKQEKDLATNKLRGDRVKSVYEDD